MLHIRKQCLSSDLDRLDHQQVSSLVNSLGRDVTAAVPAQGISHTRGRYRPYGAKILEKEICGGTLTSLTEENLDVLLKSVLGVVDVVHIGKIIKLLRGLGPSPLLSSDCRAVSPPPAKRQHHDATHPAPLSSFTVAPSAAATVPAIALQADSAEITKLQQHDEPKERHQQKKKQSKSGDGGSKPKSEAEARPKADVALLNAPPPPGYKGPPNSLTPSKRGDGGSKPKSEAEARPKADAALLNAPPPPGYKGPPSSLFKKTAPHDDPPSQLGKRQSKPNDSMTKAGFAVIPIGYSPQSSPLPDFDDNGWSNVCSQCRCPDKILLCCEFGLPAGASDDNLRAVCSRALCFSCARVSVAPKGTYICGAHAHASASPLPSIAASSTASTAPVPKYAATSLAATAAALAGSSLNLNTCLVLITCQYPEECALLLPRKITDASNDAVVAARDEQDHLHAVWLVEVLSHKKVCSSAGEHLELSCNWWSMPRELRIKPNYRKAYRGTWLVTNPCIARTEEFKKFVINISSGAIIHNFGPPAADVLPSQLFTQELLDQLNADIQSAVGDVTEECITWQTENAPVSVDSGK